MSDLHDEVQTAIRRYLFNPPYKGMFGTADDLTEIVMKVIEEHQDEVPQVSGVREGHPRVG